MPVARRQSVLDLPGGRAPSPVAQLRRPEGQALLRRLRQQRLVRWDRPRSMRSPAPVLGSAGRGGLGVATPDVA
eukprot:3991072-Lingulodinium_polyedra.AAC.1